jgi:hypothetical protein
MNWFIDIKEVPTSYNVIRFPGSDLALELGKLATLQGKGLSEAVAFYAGRVVEASAEDMAKRLGYTAALSLAEHMDLIGLSGRIDDGYLACGNALRRIGNHARHLDRAITGDEEATIIAMLQLWLESYQIFINNDVERCDGNLALKDWSGMTPIVRLLACGGKAELESLIAPDGSVDHHLLTEATMAAFVGERFTDARLPAAQALTAKCMTKFPRDKRVQQIRALFLSRNGRAEEAIMVLKRVLKWKKGQDIETLGILGGAFKNLWLKDGDSGKLAEANRYYTRTPDDRSSSYYLLINAAATALWLGQAEEARAHAFQAIEALKKFGVTEQWALSSETSYWLVATLAEAQLIWGKVKPAQRLYEHARNIDNMGGRWARTLEQLNIHLRFLPNARGQMEALTRAEPCLVQRESAAAA